MTVVCGLAKTFMQLFVARIGVGVGEATLQPCAASLLSDYFPREKRGRALEVGPRPARAVGCRRGVGRSEHGVGNLATPGCE